MNHLTLLDRIVIFVLDVTALAFVSVGLCLLIGFVYGLLTR